MNSRSESELSALLSAYLDDELEAVSRAEVQAYLDNNADARQLLADLSETRALLQKLPRSQAGAEFVEQVMARAERDALLGDAAGRRAAPPRRLRVFWPAAAVLVLMVAGAGSFILWQGQSRERRVVEADAPAPAESELRSRPVGAGRHSYKTAPSEQLADAAQELDVNGQSSAAILNDNEAPTVASAIASRQIRSGQSSAPSSDTAMQTEQRQDLQQQDLVLTDLIVPPAADMVAYLATGGKVAELDGYYGDSFQSADALAFGMESRSDAPEVHITFAFATDDDMQRFYGWLSHRADENLLLREANGSPMDARFQPVASADSSDVTPQQRLHTELDATPDMIMEVINEYETQVLISDQPADIQFQLGQDTYDGIDQAKAAVTGMSFAMRDAELSPENALAQDTRSKRQGGYSGKQAEQSAAARSIEEDIEESGAEPSASPGVDQPDVAGHAGRGPVEEQSEEGQTDDEIDEVAAEGPVGESAAREGQDVKKDDLGVKLEKTSPQPVARKRVTAPVLGEDRDATSRADDLARRNRASRAGLQQSQASTSKYYANRTQSRVRLVVILVGPIPEAARLQPPDTTGREIPAESKPTPPAKVED